MSNGIREVFKVCRIGKNGFYSVGPSQEDVEFFEDGRHGLVSMDIRRVKRYAIGDWTTSAWRNHRLFAFTSLDAARGFALPNFAIFRADARGWRPIRISDYNHFDFGTYSYSWMNDTVVSASIRLTERIQ
jgi:hypothetical protein